MPLVLASVAAAAWGVHTLAAGPASRPRRRTCRAAGMPAPCRRVSGVTPRAGSSPRLVPPARRSLHPTTLVASRVHADPFPHNCSAKGKRVGMPVAPFPVGLSPGKYRVTLWCLPCISGVVCTRK